MYFLSQLVYCNIAWGTHQNLTIEKKFLLKYVAQMQPLAMRLRLCVQGAYCGHFFLFFCLIKGMPCCLRTPCFVVQDDKQLMLR